MNPKSILINTVGADWLESEIIKYLELQLGIKQQFHPQNVRRRVPSHPLVSMKLGVDKLVEDARVERREMITVDANLSRLQTIDANLSTVLENLDLNEARRRLRDPNDFENYAFEIHVGAAYVRNEYSVRFVRPGSRRSFEFGVTAAAGDPEVAVECKLKDQSPWEEAANRAFGHLQFELHKAIERKDISAGVRVTLFNIPSRDDSTKIVQRVLSVVGAPIAKVEDVKFSAVIETFGPAKLRIPREKVEEYYIKPSDFGSSRIDVDPQSREVSRARLIRVDIQSLEDIEHIYTSIEGSVKKAARQLPGDRPGLVYVEIGRRSRKRARKILDLSISRLSAFLKNYSRISGVVLTAMGWSDVPGGCLYTVGNELVTNRFALHKLPNGFLVVGSSALSFGDDIMRVHPDGDFRVLRGW